MRFWKKRRNNYDARPITFIITVNADGSFCKEPATAEDATRWAVECGVVDAFIALIDGLRSAFRGVCESSVAATTSVNRFNETIIIAAPRIEGASKYNARPIRMKSATLHPVADDFRPDIMG